MEKTSILLDLEGFDASNIADGQSEHAMHAVSRVRGTNEDVETLLAAFFVKDPRWLVLIHRALERMDHIMPGEYVDGSEVNDVLKRDLGL